MTFAIQVKLAGNKVWVTEAKRDGYRDAVWRAALVAEEIALDGSGAVRVLRVGGRNPKVIWTTLFDRALSRKHYS